MPSEHLTNLTGDVTAATTVMQGATILINGFKARLDAAIADAIGKGATEAELVAASALSDEMEAKTAELSAAVQANTPAA